jgi:hypothetical protein
MFSRERSSPLLSRTGRSSNSPTEARGYIKKEGESHHGQPSDLKDGGAAYGAGTYYSSREAVGRAYARRAAINAGNGILRIGEDIYEHKDDTYGNGMEVVCLYEELTAARGDIAKARANMESKAKEYEKDADPLFKGIAVNLREALSILDNNDVEFKIDTGHLYQADIEDEALADWDKPLKEQPEKVKQAFLKLYKELYAEDYAETQNNLAKIFPMAEKHIKRLTSFL